VSQPTAATYLSVRSKLYARHILSPPVVTAAAAWSPRGRCSVYAAGHVCEEGARLPVCRSSAWYADSR
jgi:hypothetical protein